MKTRRIPLALAATALLAACGGGDGGGSTFGGGTGSPGPTPTPTTSPTTSACSLSEEQAFAKAAIDQWYLFPDLVDTSVSPASHATVQGYIDALVAPARAQRKDRYFTYVTSIAEENAFYESGATAGFGFRLGYGTNFVVVLEGFEGAPALDAGLDRATQILAVGTSAGTLRDTSDIMAGGGPSAFIDALGPDDAGVTRVFRIRQPNGTEQTVTLSKADFPIDPVSDRYGAKVIDNGGTQVGYINLRNFIDPADPDLRAAFADFRSKGIDNLVIDLRYNRGGLVSIANLMGDLMGRDEVGNVFSRTTFRASKSDQNSTRLFQSAAQSIAPVRIAFIAGPNSASASELVINAMIPYLGTDMALIGSNTYGKPVGQYAFDNSDCDQRMRVVTFRTENADGNADYFDGLATTVPVTCQAYDDYLTPLGDPTEDSLATALDFLAGRSCTPIATGTQSTRSLATGRDLLIPDQPSAAQREVPGLF